MYISFIATKVTDNTSEKELKQKQTFKHKLDIFITIITNSKSINPGFPFHLEKNSHSSLSHLLSPLVSVHNPRPRQPHFILSYSLKGNTLITSLQVIISSSKSFHSVFHLVKHLSVSSRKGHPSLLLRKPNLQWPCAVLLPAQICPRLSCGRN